MIVMSDLTPKQEAFAQAVASGLSYLASYHAAYDVSVARGKFAASEAFKLKTHPAVSKRISELQRGPREKLDIRRGDLVRWHLARMAYNPDELIKTVTGACRHCHGDGHAFHWRITEYLDACAQAEAAVQSIPLGRRLLGAGADVQLPDVAGGFGYNATAVPHPSCPHCDGLGVSRTVVTPAAELTGSARAAYEGVKETKNGLEVKMADKHASAVEVAKLCGFNVERAAIGADDDVADIAPLDGLDVEAVARVYKKMMGQGSTAH